MRAAAAHPRHGALVSRYDVDADGYILSSYTIPRAASTYSKYSSFTWTTAYDTEGEDWKVANIPQYRLENGVPVKRRSTSAANPIADLERRVTALEGG